MKSNIGESGEDADPELIENLSESKAQLEALKQKLSELNAIKKTQIPADTKEQMESAQKELSAKRVEFDAAYQKLEAAKATLDQKQAEINDGQTQINSVKAYISSKENELNTAKNTYAAGKRDYENGLVSYNQNLNLYYRGLDEWNSGFNTLNKKEKKYQANLAKYNSPPRFKTLKISLKTSSLNGDKFITQLDITTSIVSSSIPKDSKSSIYPFLNSTFDFLYPNLLAISSLYLLAISSWLSVISTPIIFPFSPTSFDKI